MLYRLKNNSFLPKLHVSYLQRETDAVVTLLLVLGQYRRIHTVRQAQGLLLQTRNLSNCAR